MKITFFELNKNIDIYHGYRISLVSLETNLTCTNIKGTDLRRALTR